jgi:2-polyprenyl-3-methyl-5-hydroxy-6-metoxy-1,4-benzoquinol methylase
LAEFDSFAANYQELVNDSIRVTGESSDYFAAYKAAYIARRVAPRSRGTLLDYGCGVGLLSQHLKSRLAGIQIDGFDVSKDSLARIDGNLLRQGTFSTNLEDLAHDYDVLVLSNVLHHVKLDERQELIREAASRLAHDGKLIIFEHNPLNPLTRWAVSQCFFDEDAVLLPSREARGYCGHAGLRSMWRDYIVFFPRWLEWFRPLEPSLHWCPLGAQYVVVGGR